MKKKLLNAEDVELLFIAKNCREALTIIRAAFKSYKKGDKRFCQTFKKYKL